MFFLMVILAAKKLDVFRLFGYGSSRNTEVYTHVSKKRNKDIGNINTTWCLFTSCA